MASMCRRGSPRVTELVWDIDASGTCTGSDGATIRTGEGGDWDSEQLLALALESDLMESFLRLARQRGLAVLGYVSAAHFHPADRTGNPARLCVHPCVVVGSAAAAKFARGLMAEAYARWDLARLLRERPRLEFDVTTVEEQAPTTTARA